MKNIFFDDEFVKNFKTAVCPNCKKEIDVEKFDTEVICDDCGERCETEGAGIYSEDFVWHPSERY